MKSKIMNYQKIVKNQKSKFLSYKNLFLFLIILGGVLFFDITDQPRWEQFARKIGISRKLASKVDDIFWEYQEKLNTGKMTADELKIIIEGEIGRKLKIKSSFQEAIIREFKPNPSILSLLDKLRPRYRLGLLTNMYAGMFAAIKKRHLLPDGPWEVIIDSSKVGLAKPDPAIYKYAQRLAKVPAGKILFIDNSATNIAPAQAMGWQTVLYNPQKPEESNKKIEKYLDLR